MPARDAFMPPAQRRSDESLCRTAKDKRSEGACASSGCVPSRSASAALAPAAVDNGAPESCESASTATEASWANENRAAQDHCTARKNFQILRKAQPPYPQ